MSFRGRVALAFAGISLVLWQIAQLSGSLFSDSEPAKFRLLDSMQHSKFHRIGVLNSVHIGSVETPQEKKVFDFKFSDNCGAVSIDGNRLTSAFQFEFLCA